MVCFKCGKKILEEEKKRILPLDVPYVNLHFHAKPCYEEADGDPNYIEENFERIIEYIKELGEAKFKKRAR